MSFTALAAKTNGSTSISRAEVVDLFDNIAWLRCPPTYRLYAVDGGETWGLLVAAADYAIIGSPHFEWLEGGGFDPGIATYHSGSGGLYVNVGDVEPGVWLDGVMIAARRFTTAEEGLYGIGDYWRHVRLSRPTSSTRIADVYQQARRGRRSSFHVAGQMVFNATEDRVDAQIRAAEPVNVPSEFQPDRRWGLWWGENTSLSSGFAAARPESDGEQVDWWNTLRLNLLRIQRRPSCGRIRSTTGTINANTPTTIFLLTTDWSTHPDMAPGANGRIVAPYDGWYYVEGQVEIDDYNIGETFATVSIVNNLGATVLSANAAEIESLGFGGLVTTAIVNGFVKMTAGQTLELVATIGRTETIASGRGQRMSATLVSSNSGVSPKRQKFGPIPAPADLPDFSAYSSNRLPIGVMRIASDVVDRLWHQPVIALRSADPQSVGADWTDVETSVLVDDYTDMRALGYEPVGRGGFVVPWPGTWVVCGRVSVSPTSEAGVEIGNQGFRGVRLAVDGKQAVGQILTAGMNAAGHGWTKTVAEEFVINPGREGAVIGLQACAGDLSADEEAVVTSAQLWALQRGDGVTRDPS